MFIILITLVTISVAHTSDIIVIAPNKSYYRVPTQPRKANNPYETSYQSTPHYEYASGYSDMSVSDIVYQGHGLNVNRRADTAYAALYNNGQWPMITTTEANQLHNRKKNANKFGYVTQITEKNLSVKETNTKYELNEPVNESKNTYKRSDDVNKLADQKQVTYTENPQGINTTLNRNNELVSGQLDNTNYSSTDQGSITFYHNIINHTKTDNNIKTTMSDLTTNTTVNVNNSTLYKNKTVEINNTSYDTKTIVDNEVTKTYEGAPPDSADDRWVWPSGDILTTTLVPLDDRAAFTADGCPTGKVRFGKLCIVPD